MLPYIDEAEVTITSNDPNTVTRSRSGRKISRNLEQQRWEIAVTWPNYLDAKSLVLEVALDAMKGQSIDDDIIHPVRSYHKDATSNWQVQTTTQAGAESIQITGGGSLTVGHYIRFNGHSKVYRVMSSSDNTVSIFPKLRRAVFAAEAVITQAVPITVTRTDDAISYKTKGPLTTVSASFEEML
ncbi:hypothetical protein MSP8886_01446 [Marinomonas spartinae]|uniref:Uncharacterized protein n=1 Tax=Marinomonas spartinae TaxID=1792290 RepID=A0A1A8TBE5_9GAMM|nr:hypothetical protein [Marinomonas spartinae]SBS29120.1 hypothetical protein MSP8886_01446 [Marinomonas spartinae]